MKTIAVQSRKSAEVFACFPQIRGKKLPVSVITRTIVKNYNQTEADYDIVTVKCRVSELMLMSKNMHCSACV